MKAPKRVVEVTMTKELVEDFKERGSVAKLHRDIYRQTGATELRFSYVDGKKS